MNNYIILYKLIVKHSYFKSNKCEGLSFYPFRDTENKMRNLDLIIRFSHNTFIIFYNKNKKEILHSYLQDENDTLQLNFRILTGNPNFKNLTGLNFDDYLKVLWFNISSNEIFSGETKNVSNNDLRTINSFNGLIARSDVYTPPLGIFQININSTIIKKAERGDSNKTIIQFHARQSFWRYYLIPQSGDISDLIRIKDSDDNITFSSPHEVSLPNAERALLSESSEKLEIQQNTKYSFQLIERNTSRERVLMKRLPVASADMVKPESNGNRIAYYSDIYIYY